MFANIYTSRGFFFFICQSEYFMIHYLFVFFTYLFATNIIFLFYYLVVVVACGSHDILCEISLSILFNFLLNFCYL